MRRRRRDVVLDFTSLLDVTLIILFYFILFSRLDVEKAQQQAQQQTAAAASVSAEADARIEQAEQMLSEAERRRQEAEYALSALQEADARSASNIEALLAFGEGNAMRLRLYLENGIWRCTVKRGGTQLAELKKGDDIPASLRDALQSAGYQPEDTVLCEFIYPAGEAGSRAAYQEIAEGLLSVQKQYPHLYLSETDLSE